MRIVILTNDYPPHARGGVGVIAHEHAEGLKRRSHDVMVICNRPAFLNERSLIRFFHHLSDLFPNRLLAEKIMAFSPDILMTYNLTGCGMGTARTVQRNGVRWIHHAHDVQLAEPSGQIVHGETMPWLRSCWRRGWSRLRRAFFGVPDVVISPSRWLCDFHRAYGFFRDTDMRILPNPIPSFDVRAAESESSGPVISNKDLLYVGRLDPDKGILILVDAWRSLGPERPTLHLIGNGSLRDAIERNRDPKVIFHGQLDHNRVQRFYRARPTVAVPSLVHENQPTVILEALSFGCPVVASKIGGIPEMLPEDCLFAPGDVAALKDAIVRVRSGSGINPSDHARFHDPDTVLVALESILKSNL